MKTLIAAILLATTLSAADLTLTWRDNSNNEDGFEVWRKVNDGQRSGTWVMFYARASGISASDAFKGHIGEMIYSKSEFSSSDRDIVEDSMLNWFSIS